MRLGRIFGRRRDEPCIPCGDPRTVRQFSLNPPAPRAITDDLRPHLMPGRRFTVVDGQVVLYDPIGVTSQILNSGAAMVWATVDGQRTVADIIDTLVADTGADRAVIDHDVRDTLSRFVGLGVVTVEPELDLPLPAAPADADPAFVPRAQRWAPAVAAALDALPWPTVIGPVRASGADVVVRTSEPSTADALRRVLDALPPSAPLGAPADGVGANGADGSSPLVVSVRSGRPGSARGYRLYVDGERRWSNGDPDALVETVMSEITQRAVEGTAGHLRFHAGAVERDGQVALITGDSGRGKSTLTAALVQRGLAYLTDEAAAVDPATGAVLPYPKAIDLDDGARTRLGLGSEPRPVRAGSPAKRPVAPRELGTVSTGGRLALIVMLDEQIEAAASGADAGDASPVVRAVLDLIGVTFGPSFDDELVLDQLATVAASVPRLRLVRGPLPEMADQVEAALVASR